ncbi:hypothetical protein V6N12_052160 [Hibiscus sabdariffa]|uniref:Uncharacterized protein n=1 Tax=Hibiscus sabdariffa TaxID=183260 RepID=A0ABR2GHQ8_9ROSI
MRPYLSANNQQHYSDTDRKILEIPLFYDDESMVQVQGSRQTGFMQLQQLALAYFQTIGCPFSPTVSIIPLM